MNRYIYAFTLTYFTLFFHTLAIEKEDSRPNIIYITPNRLGSDQLKQYDGLSHKTPNIDYLADNGMTFYYFLSRINMGSSHRAIFTGVSDAIKGFTSRVYPIHFVEYFLPLELDKVGYETCFVGKWRPGGWSSTKVQKFLLNKKITQPETLGFKHYWGIHTSIGAPKTEWGYIEEPHDPYWDKTGIFHSNTISTKGTNDNYQPHNAVRYISNFIDHNQKRKVRKPFFLWWSMIYLYNHSALWYPRTPSSSGGSSDSAYYANIRYMDKMIGRLITKLKKHKILDNSIIIFSSISGTPKKSGNTKGVKGFYRGQDSYGTNYSHLRSDWGIIYREEVLEKNYRLPLIVHWPKYIKKKQVNSELCSIEDMFHTIAKLGHAKGINKFINSNETYKSYSLISAFLGHKNKGETRNALFMFVQPRLMTANFEEAIYRFAQNRNYKLYANGEFYNIHKDPDEKRTLSQLSPIEKAIKKQLKYYISINPSSRKNKQF